MTENNRSPFAPKALATQPPHPELRHPFFANTRYPNGQDCQDALRRVACMIELLDHFDPDKPAQGELSPEALSGYRHLTEILRETFTYSRRRLAILNRKREAKRRRKARKKDRYLTALLQSLAALDSPVANEVR